VSYRRASLRPVYLFVVKSLFSESVSYGCGSNVSMSVVVLHTRCKSSQSFSSIAVVRVPRVCVETLPRSQPVLCVVVCRGSCALPPRTVSCWWVVPSWFVHRVVDRYVVLEPCRPPFSFFQSPQVFCQSVSGCAVAVGGRCLHVQVCLLVGTVVT
jgi:hypothetical protein